MDFCNKLEGLSLENYFQPCLMFVGKARAPLVFPDLALPANIRLGWKGLPGTNTLAYYKNPLITAVKSFIVQAPDDTIRKLYSTGNLLMRIR
jgi:hypothetical protein